MDDSRDSPNGERNAHHKEWLIVRLPRHLLEYLRQWAAEEEVTVSAVVEDAVTKLCEELRSERAKRFQQAKTERESRSAALLLYILRSVARSFQEVWK